MRSLHRKNRIFNSLHIGTEIISAQLKLAFSLIFALQVYLVFHKTINWDEFLHFSQIYQLKAGTLQLDLQVLHARLFAWLPQVTTDLISQILISRMVMLGCEVIIVAMVIRLATLFADLETAFLTGLVYLASGYVTMHGFSFRPDPMATAVLMLALVLLAERRLNLISIVVIGILIGFAGMLTTKSILYLPCFAGISLYRILRVPTRRLATIIAISAIPVIAGTMFYALFQLHRSGLPVAPSPTGTITSNYKPFVQSGLFARGKFIAIQAAIAPILSAAILMTPFLWLKATSRRPQLAAQIGLYAVLCSLIFYRNTYPYFFVMLLAPVAAASAPSICALKKRYGQTKFVIAVMLTPIVVIAIEPLGILPNQRALIAEIHRLYPEPTAYLAYTGTIPDYPRIHHSLISGVGLNGYYMGGYAAIAEKINSGIVGFVLADSPPVEAGLEGRQLPESFQSADFAALHDNFVHYAGPIWVAGKAVCPSPKVQVFNIVRPGSYSFDGSVIKIDGKSLSSGQNIHLDQGEHLFLLETASCAKLWAFPEIPKPPEGLPKGPFMSGF